MTIRGRSAWEMVFRVAAARRLRDLPRRAEWLTAAFEAGRVPGFLTAAAGAELDLADLALRSGDVAGATRAVTRILPLLFNRAAHFDGLASPCAADPHGFLAPLHRSAAGRALAAARSPPGRLGRHRLRGLVPDARRAADPRRPGHHLDHRAAAQLRGVHGLPAPGRLLPGRRPGLRLRAAAGLHPGRGAAVAGAGRTAYPRVTNAVQLEPYRRPKSPEARFTLGPVGLNAIAKDPRWAFEVLRELRRHDERYTLVLVGPEFDGTTSAAAAAYHERYARDLADLEARGAVRRTGPSDDVPAVLTGIGVVLSTSVRESFHLGLVEGAASRAVPVVRDWPFFAGRTAGARSIFPAEWVVRTPREAAGRILARTATAETWPATGRAASAHAMATWDWSVTRAEYDRLLCP